MRFTKLPDSVIADIADRMDHSDVRNLMLTSKRMYIAIKAYKKDKIKCKQLDIESGVEPVAIHRSGKKYKFKEWDQNTVFEVNFKKTLESCDSVDNLSVHSLDRGGYNVLMNTKVKIGYLGIFLWETLHPEEMLLLGSRFSAIFYFQRERNTVLTDAILTKLLPRSTLGLQWDVVGVLHTPKPITDLTVDALVSGDQKTFCIRDVHNYITIKGIVRNFMIHREKYGTYGLGWNFGNLRNDQSADAEKYFGENGELRELCSVSVIHATAKNILLYEITGEDFFIIFGIDQNAFRV